MTIAEAAAKLKGRSPALPNGDWAYGILVPLIEWAGEPHLLFEVRADTLKHQPGEVCFPGGRIEPGEAPDQCALRESWEELGIYAASAHLIAPLDLIAHQSGYLVHPFLAVVQEEAIRQIRANLDEVKETFLVPLAFFLGTAPQCYTCRLVPQVDEDFPYERIGFPGGYPWRGGQVEVPLYQWENRVIWGLTARIVRNLVQLLTIAQEVIS